VSAFLFLRGRSQGRDDDGQDAPRLGRGFVQPPLFDFSRRNLVSTRICINELNATFSAPRITCCLINLNQTACPVWDKNPVKLTVFYTF
jgi:hypothetical protein